MATVLKKILDGFNVLNDIADPRARIYPLIEQPLLLFGMTAFYLYFIQSLGPRVMQNKKPVKLQNLMVFYNLFQVVMNVYICYCILASGIVTTYSWTCEPLDYERNDIISKEVIRLAWLYFVLKCTDLIDTVFMVLKKNFHQVSFLHSYHHALMVLSSWIATKYYAGGHSWFVGFANCVVHAIMYSYYLLTVLKPETKKSLWWKKHLTQLQMSQFILVFVFYSQTLIQPSCQYPKGFAFFITLQSCVMIYLFGNFYVKTYLKPKLK